MAPVGKQLGPEFTELNASEKTIKKAKSHLKV